jgi:tRNA nucleotidyltransferase/poly(A) polymerase
MKIYRVGGAVRDKLLNYFSDENDWLVVGATPEKMVELGYLPAAKNMPWRAQSANQAMATAALPSMLLQMSALKKIWYAAI